MLETESILDLNPDNNRVKRKSFDTLEGIIRKNEYFYYIVFSNGFTLDAISYDYLIKKINEYKKENNIDVKIKHEYNDKAFFVKKIVGTICYHDLSLLIFNDCYANSKTNNDINFLTKYFETWEDVKEHYGSYPYIVYSQYDTIGFFFDDFDKTSNAIGLSIYLKKDNSNKKNFYNMNVVLFLGIIINYINHKRLNYKFLELNTFSNYIVNFVKKIISNVFVYKVRKEYIILHGELEKLDLSLLDKITNKYFKKEEDNIYEFLLPLEEKELDIVFRGNNCG